MTALVLAFAAGSLTGLGLGSLIGSALGWRARRARPGRGTPAAHRVLARAGAAWGQAPQDLDRRILAAGRPGGLGAREVMAGKLAGAAAGGVVGIGTGALAPGRLGVLLVLGAPVGGFLAPDLWLSRREAARARAVRRDLPGMLDLLRVTVDAGASLQAAIEAVGQRSRGPLAVEWRAVGRETALGAPLGEALAAMANRLPQPEVEALCGALERARRHGAPLGRTLSAQARDARSRLRRHVQEEAARAGPKIQLVVALMLVPSVLLMVAAALAVALLDSGGLPGW